MKLAAMAIALLLTACGSDEGVPGYNALSKQVAGTRVGSDADQWIEMRSLLSGEWDRTGLIFGYTDDHDECTKAIAGLKKVNYAREYRCTPAN